MNNTIRNTTIGLATAVILISASTSVFAADDRERGQGWGLQNIITQIAERFGLNEVEVRTVVEETQTANRAEHRKQRQEEMNDRLDKLVADGIYTQEQKELILQKHEEHQSDEPSRGAHHEEMEAWATEHNIDLTHLHPEGFGPKNRMNRSNR
ncbi:MAG: hypothetical protein ACOCXQ_01975 [Patescibacteria group bacterium]